jgi:hypothetical protein
MMSNVISWSIPAGKAADSSQKMVIRMRCYVDTHTTRLKNGKRIRPNIKTMYAIMKAYDEFGPSFPVVVSHDSYNLLYSTSSAED